MKKLQSLAVALAAVLLVSSVFAADEASSKKMALTVCYTKASVFKSGLDAVPGGSLSESSKKDTGEFLAGIRAKLGAVYDDVDIVPTCMVRDYEGRVTLLLRFRMFNAAFQDDKILAEVFTKTPGEDKGEGLGGEWINTSGNTPETAAEKVWEKIKGKI